LSNLGQETSRELRLDAIRREAEKKGRVESPGVRPSGAPMPVATPATGYYGQPLLKEPQWTPLIPVYFFVGGATGALGVIGSLADLIGRENELALVARRLALGGAAVSGVLLVVDLGRPSRFLNMLRVFKPQSAMSMGSWVLSAFSASAAVSCFSDFLSPGSARGLVAKLAAVFGRVGSVLLGMPFHNYTGVLIGATAIPVWNDHARLLPREFGMSGLQSAVSVLELVGFENRASLNWLGLLSAGTETAELVNTLKEKDRVSEPLRRGQSGLLIKVGMVLSGPVPTALRLAAGLSGKRQNGLLRRMAACSGILGSLFMRYGWMAAGRVSARDWRLPLQIEEPAFRFRTAKIDRLTGNESE
jgi:hypothetical protein